jgi:ATP-dependent RNA helicase DeaD
MPEELLDRGEGPAQRQDGPRPGVEDTVWFRMAVGRRDNADPRWILPLLCRRGHITRGEIGAIRITANETLFEVRRASAGRFMTAVKRTAKDGSGDEDSILIEEVQGAPRDEARKRKANGPQPERHKPKRFTPKGPGGRPNRNRPEGGRPRR